MNEDQARRLATMLEMVVRDTTSAGERDAALAKIADLTGGRSLVDVFADMRKTESIEQVNQRSREPSERERPWVEWKAEHLKVVAERDKLRRQVSFLESPKFMKRKPTPDAEGKIPYPYFIVALLAARDWHIRDAIHHFALLAGIDQQDVTHWREKGKAPAYFYEMIKQLDFSSFKRVEVRWDAASEAMLREYFTQEWVLPDREIAEEMGEKMGIRISGHAVHCKAQELGLLKGVKRIKRRIRQAKRKAA